MCVFVCMLVYYKHEKQQVKKPARKTLNIFFLIYKFYYV